MLSFAIRRILQTVRTVLAVVLVIFCCSASSRAASSPSMSDEERPDRPAGRGAHEEAARPRRSPSNVRSAPTSPRSRR